MLMRRLTVCVPIVPWVVTEVELCTSELIASLYMQICSQQVTSIIIDVPGPAVDSGSHTCTHTA